MSRVEDSKEILVIGSFDHSRSLTETTVLTLLRDPRQRHSALVVKYAPSVLDILRNITVRECRAVGSTEEEVLSLLESHINEMPDIIVISGAAYLTAWSESVMNNCMQRLCKLAAATAPTIVVSDRVELVENLPVQAVDFDHTDGVRDKSSLHLLIAIADLLISK